MSPDRPARGISIRTRSWFWLGLWALFIWGLGGDELSFDHTSRFLGPLIRWLLPGVSEETQQLLLFSIRKTAHLVEYAVLGVLALRALSIDQPSPLLRSTVMALVLCTAFATADEVRQSLSATRMGSVWDVLLDALGAAAGIAVLLWARRHLPGFDRRFGFSKPPGSPSTESPPGGSAQ